MASQIDEELNRVKEKVLESLKSTRTWRLVSQTAEIIDTFEENNRLHALIVVTRNINNNSSERFSILCIIDKSKEKCDKKRVGTLKFKGDLGSSNLKEFIQPLVTALNFNEGRVYWMENSSVVQRIKLPGIEQMHRYKSREDWVDFCRSRWWMWGMGDFNSENRDFKKIAPPDPSPNKATGKMARFQPEDQFYEALMECQQDRQSYMSLLPSELILKIYDDLMRFWAKHIINNKGGVYASVVAKVIFPKYTGIQCNMMPFKMGQPETIPEQMRQYLPLLACCPIKRLDIGAIGYLTIHESVIGNESQSQRRGGVHTETPGRIWLESSDPALSKGVGGEWIPQSHPVPLTVAWGRGCYDMDAKTNFEYDGGLFMASNVSDSTRVWNCQIAEPETAVGNLGDLEHLRGALGEGETLREGEVVWMTDTTPHESLPLKAGTRRQYFRLVTSSVNVWYADHSTANPLGVKPPEEVIIIYGDKFSQVRQQFSKFVK